MKVSNPIVNTCLISILKACILRSRKNHRLGFFPASLISRSVTLGRFPVPSSTVGSKRVLPLHKIDAFVNHLNQYDDDYFYLTCHRETWHFILALTKINNLMRCYYFYRIHLFDSAMNKDSKGQFAFRHTFEMGNSNYLFIRS